ncbi:MAG: formylglycine-generating enzyme family protein [Isosphaeraceae bacterium]|nr:formylglycine-generating enzyme family protein [Isosphaeraceae bacterium]
MKTGIVGRADLLDAYLAGGPELQSAVARLLGMELVTPEPIAVPPEIRPAAAVPIPEPSPQALIPFWRAETYTRIEPLHEEGDTERVELLALDQPTADRPPPAPLTFRPLATSAAVLTKLRRVSSFSRTSGELDVARVVDHLSRGRFPGSLPRRSRKTWGQSIHVVLDEHEHLKPYRQDQSAVVQTLRRVYPRDGVEVVALPHRGGTSQLAGYQPPEPGTTVLALSDLGALALDRFEPRETWLALGKRYRENGARPIALVPCDLACIPLELTRDWIVIPWESHVASRNDGLGPDQVAQVARRILTLLSYALRLEPLLIREVRRLLIKGRLGAGVEARVWQDPALRGQDYEAAEFCPDRARQLQQDFEREAPDIRREVISLLRRGHIHEYEAVWFLERLGLEAETAKLELPDDDLGAAVRWVRAQQDVLEGDVGKRDPTSNISLWFRRAFIRLPEAPLNGSAGDSLHQIWALTSATKDHPPAGLDTARVPSLGRAVRTVEIHHAGDRLVAWTHEGGPGIARSSGSLLGTIRTRNGLIRLDEPDDFWNGGVAPAWADRWGRDRFGPWVDLRVEDARQRLRWIRPGTFWMGSPEDEEGRYPDEGPRHEETIASGFWMFDTPCTQALWEAVMGENPSEFKGLDRPIENVSWDQCHDFLKRLNERCEGLDLKLPTEAQWEYACRAGTDTPRYRENLNEIAWYSGNSQRETHSVGRLFPNAWGLYDTLGNVFEWCEDVWTPDYSTTKAATASARRVIRGGSWLNDAQYVRAAFRSHDGPSIRLHDLGFRCAEFRAPGPVGWQEDAERARERGGVGAEHSGDRDQASGAGWINLDAPGMDGVSFGALAPLRVSSDVEQVVLRTTTLPGWASAIGRDRYGLWAEFTIERKGANPRAKRARKKKSVLPAAPLSPIRQRLRWIPPGRFLMGSPLDEEGRDADEGPQHEVTIAEGFWMFDTPCTQALWEALMDKNPSEFQSPDRPVEKVSWEDCQTFLGRLNAKVDLRLSLPTEAQWEYACRAGTTMATYAGPMVIQGANNAPILDEIAWYGGNSGIEFELSHGWDASKWPEKQFEFDKAGTHPVGRKKANPWGLYDMLGNVWEWCNDAWAEDYAERSRTTTADSASAQRVFRGGSWIYVAQYVRAAYRVRDVPPDRNHDLGFRCAEFRQGVVSEARQGSEVEGAEHPGDRDPTSVAAGTREDDGLKTRPN